MKNRFFNGSAIVWLLSFIVLGCKTIKETHHETNNKEKISVSDDYKRLHIVDSVRWIDSVRIEYKKGVTDTIYIEKWKLREKTRIVKDTIKLQRVDTIKVYHDVVKYKKVSRFVWWQEALFFILGGVVVVLIFYNDWDIFGRGGGKRP